MFNKVILIGRLVADPQLRYTQTGKAVANFRIAVDRGFAGASGQPGQERERQADFFDIVTWNKLAETCANYLNKGRLVAVDGRLQVRDYEGPDGQRRRAVEIVANEVRFLDSGRGGQPYGTPEDRGSLEYGAPGPAGGPAGTAFGAAGGGAGGDLGDGLGGGDDTEDYDSSGAPF
ncbi:MAG TPA: single-stranded DNA-binding protein [Firmicutes bacterium]|nr:single-stranded DNA-binding protein [Bacillota bacterium]